MARNFGATRKSTGLNRHHFQRVDFLGDLHRSDLRGKCGARTANHHDGCNQRAEFSRHGQGHGLRHEIHGAELAQLISALQRQNQPDEKCDQGKDGQRPYAHFHRLRGGALHAQRFPLERSYEGVIGSAASERGESAKVGKAVGDAGAELRDNFHHVFRGHGNLNCPVKRKASKRLLPAFRRRTLQKVSANAKSLIPRARNHSARTGQNANPTPGKP